MYDKLLKPRQSFWITLYYDARLCERQICQPTEIKFHL